MVPLTFCFACELHCSQFRSRPESTYCVCHVLEHSLCVCVNECNYRKNKSKLSFRALGQTVGFSKSTDSVVLCFRVCTCLGFYK